MLAFAISALAAPPSPRVRCRLLATPHRATRRKRSRPAASSAAASRAWTPASRSGARRFVSRPSTSSSGTPRTASTSTDGRYEFRDVAPGRYTLRVERSGYLALTYGQRRPGEQGRPLEIAEKEVADKVDFALPRMSVISGRVLDDLGEPIAGVTVWVLQTRYHPRPPATRRDWRQRDHRYHGSVSAAVTPAWRLRGHGNDSRDLAARQRSEAGLRLCVHLFSRDVHGGPGTARQARRRPGSVRHRFQPGGGPDLDAFVATRRAPPACPSEARR